MRFQSPISQGRVYKLKFFQTFNCVLNTQRYKIAMAYGSRYDQSHSLKCFKNNQQDLCSLYTIHLDSKIKQRGSQTYLRTVAFLNKKGKAQGYIRDNQYSVNRHHKTSLHLKRKSPAITQTEIPSSCVFANKGHLASFQQLTGELMATKFIFPEPGCPCFLATFSLTVQMTENAESNCVSSRFLRQ